MHCVLLFDSCVLNSCLSCGIFTRVQMLGCPWDPTFHIPC